MLYNFLRSGPLSQPRVVKDKVVIITGASSGIGQCIALEYSKRGAKVVLAARRKEKLEEVQKLCLENGATDAAVCPTDVSSPDACENLVNFTLSTFGRVDVLVNNAGSADISAFEDYPDTKKFRKTVEVDFWGNILTTKFALEHLKQTRGQVVVTCSVGAFVPYPKQTFYNASKAALLSFYDTLRVEPIGESVAITVALPGFIKSELTTTGPRCGCCCCSEEVACC
jgi:NADP-dependent 3-hydroxy acid dehydrogenase YdfG